MGARDGNVEGEQEEKGRQEQWHGLSHHPSSRFSQSGSFQQYSTMKRTELTAMRL